MTKTQGYFHQYAWGAPRPEQGEGPGLWRGLIAMVLGVALLMPGAGAAVAGSEAAGSGDGRIHILPTLSHASIKNGETLSVQAIVKAEAGVASVEAIIERENPPGAADWATAGLKEVLGLPVVRLTLHPAPVHLGGVNGLGTMGMWQADWTAFGLEEAWYRVALTVNDREGHRYTDHSLRFSDPIAGIDAAGTSDYPDGGLLRLDATSFVFPENRLRSAVIDTENGYAYFGTAEVNQPGRVVKVALGEGSTPPASVGSLTLEPLEQRARSAVIDTENGYAYFGTYTNPGRVVKVALGDGDDPPTRVGAVLLDSGENQLISAVIDTENGYAYFGTRTNPGRVVKVALGDDDDPPTRVGAVQLDTVEDWLYSAVIDPENGYAWFGTGMFNETGRVVKIALGEDDDPPTRVGAVILEPGEDALWSAVMGPDKAYAWFGTHTNPGRVVKVALGDGNDPPARVGAVTLEPGEFELIGAVIDPENGHAWFGTRTNPGRVVKVALGDGNDPPTRVGAIELETGESLPWGAVIDPESGHAWFGTDSAPGRVVRVALSQQGFVKATRLTMPEDGVVSELRFYTHEASGNLRLALYVDGPNPALVWESGVVANTAEDDWLSVPFSSGTPSYSVLPAGDYWLAWQVDTMASVPSYSAGPADSGLMVSSTFGPFPATLEESTPTEPVFTDENWSAYVVYDTDITPPNAVTITPSTTGPTNATNVDFTVAFDEPVQNFDDASDLDISHSGTANTGATITGGPEVYTVTVEGLSGDGSFTLAVDTTSGVTDLAGNPLDSSVASAAVLIDNTAPVLSGLDAAPSEASAGQEVILTFTSSEDLSAPPDVLVNGNPASASLKSPFAYAYTVSPLDPLGPATIQINGIDLAGNAGQLNDNLSLVIVETTPGLPAAWPMLAALALLGAAAFALHDRRRRATAPQD